MLSVCTGQVTHALLTRPPLSPKRSLDLHVLGTPPAFILSQDQTLKIKIHYVHFVNVFTFIFIQVNPVTQILLWFDMGSDTVIYLALFGCFE